MYIYDSISLNCAYNEMFQTEAVQKIRTRTLFSITFFFKSYRLWENVEKYYAVGQATDGNVIRHTRLEYVILIAYHGNNGYANAPKCYVNTYTACLVKTFRLIHLLLRQSLILAALPRKEMIWLTSSPCCVSVTVHMCVCVCVYSLTTSEHVWWGSANFICPVSLVYSCVRVLFFHNLRVPYKVANFFTSWATVSFSRKPCYTASSSQFQEHKLTSWLILFQ